MIGCTVHSVVEIVNIIILRHLFLIVVEIVNIIQRSLVIDRLKGPLLFDDFEPDLGGRAFLVLEDILFS